MTYEPPSNELDTQQPARKHPGWLRWALVTVAVMIVAGACAAIGYVSRGAPAGTQVTTTVAITATITKSAAPAAPVTVTIAPATVTVTAPAPGVIATTAAPVGGGTPGPFQDGTYLINVDIQAGNYRCSDPVGGNNQSTTNWLVEDSAGNPTGADATPIAHIAAKGYDVQLRNCTGQWEKIS